MPVARRHTSRLRTALRWILRGLGGLVFLLLLVAAAGAFWQWRSTATERNALAPRGDLVEVQTGRKIHLICRGQGSPTVLLEAGLQGWSNEWLWVQPVVAKTTRVCAYDRAGLGWSDPRPGPHDGLAAVADLRLLLESAPVAKPLIFVGHSYGGLLARIYYEHYPEDLAGMVLLEPGDPDDVLAWAPEPREKCGRWCTMAAIAARLGLVRFLYRGKLENPGYPPGFRDELVGRFSQAHVTASFTADLLALATAAQQARETRSLADLPLRVLVSSNPDEVGTSFENEQERRTWLASYREFWERLATSSHRGVPPVTVPGANHVTMVLLEEPARLVAREIQTVVELARGRSPTPQLD